MSRYLNIDLTTSADSQRRAMTLLKNVDPSVASHYAEVVPEPKEADFAILRLETPWVPAETKTRLLEAFITVT